MEKTGCSAHRKYGLGLFPRCRRRGSLLVGLLSASWRLSVVGTLCLEGLCELPLSRRDLNGEGECVEFITEGPDSKMVGALKAQSFPTRTLKGIVFVWMGEGEPVAIEED